MFSCFLLTQLNALCSYNHLQKMLEKLHKLRKSCNHKQDINRIYSDKLHYTLPPAIADFKS